jgi:hypothetical protein
LSSISLPILCAELNQIFGSPDLLFTPFAYGDGAGLEGAHRDNSDA